MTDTDRLIARLLGPAEPELTCDECFEHLDLYVELGRRGEDPEKRIRGMRAHLEGCPACAEEAASLRALIE
jgi:anti-sigma factor RsiW